MIIALVDNGSLEPAAHRNLRAVARALSARAGVTVHAVSWKHSDRISPASLDDTPAWTLAPFIRALVALGQQEFILVPFFISVQGAIGSALRRDLENLQEELGAGSFEFTLTDGLTTSRAIPAIVAARIRTVLAEGQLIAPPVVVVDHGGPSPASAEVRNELAAQIRVTLADEIGPLVAASMEGEEHAHNHPLLADQLDAPGFDRGDVIVAPLFLSPGRHAGATGDLAQIARAAEDRMTLPPLRCHFAELVGTHPLAIDELNQALHRTLSHLHAPSFA
jgi:sirohydrochlorin ferrochelatase